ncbi:hypothetical protein, variant [Verruconis gallopava]|uniref:Tubulin-specific chaperone A n=1 Tax=Verruconis gallopava TaxID=253628 RepID=A0A0D1YQV4_9PEZI|nr:hypothetical protein, variant [Verruconis gallopava]KIW02952.1 hypothetical protein, variant [Verruconis gallopava]
MAPPSKLAIATSVVRRLMKEEASYHKEIEQQQIRIQTMENSGDGENVEYELKQEKQALAETRTVLISMKGKIQKAINQLEEEIVCGALSRLWNPL